MRWNFPNVIPPPWKAWIHRRKNQNTQQKTSTWKPPFHHPLPLLLAISICWSLFITLHFLLTRSQRDSGIIFASSIDDLPLSTTFLFRYLPTLLSILFSIFWACIDLETKRLEPYYRLSNCGEEGVKGEESLLLEYSFEFLVVVPWKAVRRRHWAVVWASFAFVLITWGIIPTQAGIFSVRSITRTIPTTFSVSTSFMPAAEQPYKLGVRFAQSVYGILALNETLPPYMTRDYMLAPFKPSNPNTINGVSQVNGEWTAPTTMYSLDLTCEPAVRTSQDNTYPIFNSSYGCTAGVGLGGNLSIGDFGGTESIKKNFSAMYVGYWNVGFSDYYLDPCPVERNHTFYAAFTWNKKRAEDPPHNATAIYCEPTYYSQEVNATVDAITKRPTRVVPLGPKHQLLDTMFNSTWLETQMSGGTSGIQTRADVLPGSMVPDYQEQLASTELTLVGDRQPMVGLAVAAGQRPLHEYLDPSALEDSYEKANRLLFARAMVDVLGKDITSSQQSVGHSVIPTEAVVVQPLFTYIVEGLLAVVSLCAIALLYVSATREMALHSDPSTIASVMSLVADNQTLLSDFANLDCCSIKEIEKAIRQKNYKLITNEHQTRWVYDVKDVSNGMELTGLNSISETHTIVRANEQDDLRQRHSSERTITKPVRPLEFRWWVSALFIGSLITLAVLLAALFVKARVTGLPLPSRNKIVQALLENYIPTAIATIIEPTWILINRLLCLLQPLEQLRAGNAKARESIDLNYSSLPPQITMLKAIRARHFVLAAVCAMALLANLLAVAFGGLFNHDTIQIRRQATFGVPYDLKIMAINGSIGPMDNDGQRVSGAYQGGNGEDQFLIAESNSTMGTPLPTWVNDNLFYLPFTTPRSSNNMSEYQYEAETKAFGAELDCNRWETDSETNAVSIGVYATISQRADVNASIIRDGIVANCTGSVSNINFKLLEGTRRNGSCERGAAGLELVWPLENKSLNASQAQKELCWGTVILGWIRDRHCSYDGHTELKLNANNSYLVQCSPRLVRGQATIRIDETGRILETANLSLKQNVSREEAGKMFSNDPINLIRQSNQYLFQSKNLWPAWHNDSFASDFINYFTRLEGNSSRLLDPSDGLPTFMEVQGPLSKAYSKLFALWLQTNMDNLLVRRVNSSEVPIPGWQLMAEERIFLSTSSFAIAEAILAVSTLVALMVYLRRPGEYLPRLPVNIASIISLFAASAAAEDMRATSQLTRRARAKHLDDLDLRYGYGSYFGIDRGVHVGIEKVPLVRSRRSTTEAGQKSKTRMFRKVTGAS